MPSPNRKTVVALVALVAVAAAAGWRLTRREPRGVEALWSAFGGTRPVEGRLSGGQPYGRYAGPAGPRHERGASGPAAGGPATRGEAPALLRAAADILQEAAERPSPESARAVGVLKIVRGELDDAVARLERAAPAARSDVLGDLAVAYLERARERDSAHDLVLAYEAADRAVEADSGSPEARFNRALALERLHLRDLARGAWAEYLALDAGSEWAAEARERSAALEAPPPNAAWDGERLRLDEAVAAGDEARAREIVERFPHMARFHAWDRKLGEWAEAEAAGRAEEAARALAVARFVCAQLARLQGDAWVRDAVAAVDRASEGGPDALRRLASLHRRTREAVGAYRSGEYDRAAGALETAAAELSDAGDEASATYATLCLAVCDLYARRYERSEAACDRVVATSEARDYTYLAGRGLWVKGLGLGSRARMTEYLETERAALARVERAGDDTGSSMVHSILADAYMQLGDPEAALGHQMRALGYVDRSAASADSSRVFDFTARVLAEADRPRAALAFEDAAVEAALAHGDAGDVASTCLFRSQLRARFGRAAEAAADLELAKGHLERVTDPTTLRMLRPHLLLTEADYALEADPARAARLATEVLEHFEGTSHRWLSVRRAYLLRARANRRLGAAEAAEADLLAALAEYEHARGTTAEDRYRVSSFRKPQQTFDEMISLQLDERGSPELAFDYSERARARALLDLLDGPDRVRPRVDAGRHMTAAEVQRALPEGLVVLEYAVLSDRVVAWVVGRDLFETVALPVAAEAAASAAGALRGAVERDLSGDAPAPEAVALYDALVAPVAALLPEGAAVAIVPDKFLADVPFAALYNRAARRYFVEERALATAPSAAVLARCVRRDEALAAAGRGPSACVVGNPSFDRERWSGLPALGGAEAEARAVAALYPAAELLLGAEATPRAVLASIGRHDVLHFACHAVGGDAPPAEPSLVLAPEGDDGGALPASRLYGVAAARARLAVLAACRTGGARVGREGAGGLARPFLAAGIPAVVASYWNADDRGAALLFTRFHERIAAGDDPMSALRDAQLRLVRHQDPAMRSPRVWAAFAVFGGASTSRR